MKDYKKMLEDVVNIINTTEKSDIGFANICTYIGENCPELRESEDERVKEDNANEETNSPTGYGKYVDECLNEAAKHFFSEGEDKYSVADLFYAGVRCGKSWIEMQGEKKPADKVGPKFKRGQWVVWQNKCYKVNYNGCGYELIDQNGLSTSLEYGTIEENAHLWDISDAKDGDVIFYDDGWTGIFKHIHGNWYSSYCFITADGEFHIGYEGHAVDSKINGNVKPATREQRDILLKAMSDEGFTFDFDNKELKEIKQNPAEKVDVSMSLDEAIEHCKEKSCGNNSCALEHKQLEKWLTELKKLKEQKPWSQEDERILVEILKIFNIENFEGYDIGEDNEDALKFLKSIKDRVQPKQEWSGVTGTQ